MQKDLELDSILQEAREGYQKRIDELKNSLKSISSLEKQQKSDVFSVPIDSDSLKYSTTFRPSTRDMINGLEDLNELQRSSKKSQPEEKKAHHDENHGIQDLYEENLLMRKNIQDLEKMIQKIKSNNEESESVNKDLREKIKDLTHNLNKVSEENLRIKESKAGSSVKDFQSLKNHYKEKIGRMREELIIRDTEIAKIQKELESQVRLQTSVRQVCDSQVKEISEEYARNLKQAGNVHTEELIKLKSSFESLSESQIHEFLMEIQKLQQHLNDCEKSNRLYQEKLEKLIISKEKSEKNLANKEQELKECQVYIKDLKILQNESASKLSSHEKTIKDLQINLQDSQSLIQKFRTETEKLSNLSENQEKTFKEKEKFLESRIKQLSEENSKKQQNINKLIQELETKELDISRSWSQIQEEKSRNKSLIEKHQEYDLDFEDLSRTLETFKTRNSILEDQLNTQAAEMKKKAELEASKFNEKIRKLENELKGLYQENSVQAKELESLKVLCAQVEERQENELKQLVRAHEEKLKEIKKEDRIEYLRLCEALEVTKVNLHHAESAVDRYEKIVKDLENKEKNYLYALKNHEKYKDQVEEANIQYRLLNSKYSKLETRYFKQRENFLNQFKKIKESYKICIRSTIDSFQDFKNFQEKIQINFIKTFNARVEDQKKNLYLSVNKHQNEANSLKIALERHLTQVGLLEKELQNLSSRFRELQDENFKLKKSLDQPEKVKKELQVVLKTFFNSFQVLEAAFLENFEELEVSVRYLKDFIAQDSLQNKAKVQEIVDQARKSIEFYRDKLVKLENDKATELNKSQNELLGLQQRLSQVLEDVVKY
jgi:chromosome segregation ATPase